MKKKNKTIKRIGLIALVLLLVGVVFYFGVQQSVLGVPESIDWGDSAFSFDDGITGIGVAEGYLFLPANTTEFSFTVDYTLKTRYKITTAGTANIKYEIFNTQSNSWETIHDKSWSISGCSTCTNGISNNGETVYQTGIPEHLVSSVVGYKLYDKFFGCLNGMTVQEAQSLNVWIEGTSTYRYYCMYPDSYQKSYSYDDASDNYDLEYFPPLITKNANYVNEENKVLLRITYNPTSSGFRGMDEGDFRVHLWSVETPKTNVYFLNVTECISQEKYTYQIATTDYYSLDECEYQNNLTECYLTEQCSCTNSSYNAICIANKCECKLPEGCGVFNPCSEGYECQNKNCILSPVEDDEPPITGDVIDETPKDINFPMLFMYSMIAIAVLGIIIVVIKRRK